MVKLKNSTHDFYEITRLNKEVCLEVVKKIEDEFPRFKLDHLSYISLMAQHDYFTENQLKKLVIHLSRNEVSKKL
jgi:hypothetical protein